jgi:hypothetical protein
MDVEAAGTILSTSFCIHYLKQNAPLASPKTWSN